MSKKRERIEWVGLTPEEEKIATKSFKSYKSCNHIERTSEIEDLKNLIFCEVLLRRMQIKLGVFEKKNEFATKNMVDSYNNVQSQILNLKQKLGLLEKKKESNFFNYIQLVLKKFRIWKEENLNETQVTCPHCSKIIFLNIKTSIYNALKHPFFLGKIVANKELWKVYKSKEVLTKKNIANIFGTSEDYISWLEEKIFSKRDEI